MITFRSVDLETAVPGIKIEDIRVSAIELEPTARKRPINPGTDFVRMVQGNRTIEITFGIIEQNAAARQQALSSLTEWARSAAPAAMSLPNRTGKLIDVICTALPDPSTRQWWESRLSMTFTAFEPFFYSTTEKSAACGTAFSVSGDAPPIMRIERSLSSAASNQGYSDGRNTMTFSTIPAGSLVIDLNRQTAAVNGSSIMQYYSYLSSFIIPRTGAVTITGAGTVYYRERWEA